MDALAFEPQFLDHLAPVWHALGQPGTFLVDPSLVERARAKGIAAVAQPRPRHEVAYPPPRFDGPEALVASYGDIKEARRLGYGPFAFLEHGAGQTYDGQPNGSYSGGPDRADNGLILVPHQRVGDIWQRAYPNARIAVVGCPKLDSLPLRDGGGPPTVAISFHWRAPLSVSGYAGNALGDFLPILPELAKRYEVIGHAHPKGDWPDQLQRLYQRAGIRFVREFEDVCRQADVYVCDNSSTIFEFAATGRPVVLLNAKVWSRKHDIGLRFWDAADVGINVWPQDDLFTAIDEALADPPERQIAREAALAKVYGLRTNGAAAAATAINDWLAA